MKSGNRNSSRSFHDLIEMFSYDQDLSLDIKEKDIKHLNGISIHDISYSGRAEERCNAYLVKPRGESPFAGLIFVHPAPGSRDTFLKEAVELADKGALSLLIDAPWAHADFVNRIMELFQVGLGEWYVQILIDLRRGIDLLVSLPNIDSDRLGYVGHSFGALFGGILAGVEIRINSYVLMAGTGSFADVAVANMPDLPVEMLENHRKMMEPIDPIHYIGHASPSALFFQSGLNDTLFRKDKSLNYYNQASEPKSIKWYDAGHYLNEEAHRDRIEWLNIQFGLKKIE